jgi:hypothetical protein
MTSAPAPDAAAHREALRRAVATFASLGGAERAAMAAETQARSDGATDGDLEGFTAEVLGAAGCEEYLDALRLLSWRARGLSRALEFINLGGPRGTEDAMMLPIVVTAAALADLATASFVIRDPDSENSARDDAAASWRDAIGELTRLTGNAPIELSTGPKVSSPDA